MLRIRSIFLEVFLFFVVSTNFAQVGESPFRLFGYFQTQLAHQQVDNGFNANTFNMQQMNVFVQKDLAKDWTTLVDFEFLNSYSSSRFWGAFNLTEAWVRYRASQGFNLKIGLQIPIFNNLNEINNRTPLLPYIVRPLAYETSYAEIIDIEAFTPKRTFLQAYGYFPLSDLKIDYAVYIGNSPNISVLSGNGQSGIDTTNTFLLGGRTGIRFDELKAGISFTYDFVAKFKGLDTLIGLPPAAFNEVGRIRFGADLSYTFKNLSFETEYIRVQYDDGTPNIDLDKIFFYGTLGYHFTDNILGYVSYWYIQENTIIKGFGIPNDKFKIKVPTIGAAYNFNDRIRLKAQYASVTVLGDYEEYDQRFKYYAVAVSVFF